MTTLYIFEISRLLTLKLVYTLKTHTQVNSRIFFSYDPWRIKTAWVKALFQRAVKICSTEEILNQQIKKISLFMSRNGSQLYLKSITRPSVIKC